MRLSCVYRNDRNDRMQPRNRDSRERNYNNRDNRDHRDNRDNRDNRDQRENRGPIQRDQDREKPKRTVNPEEIENRMPKFQPDVKPVSTMNALIALCGQEDIQFVITECMQFLFLSLPLLYRNYKCQTHMKFSMTIHLNKFRESKGAHYKLIRMQI